MSGEEAAAIEASLNNVKNTCKMIKAICSIAFALAIIVLMALLATAFMNLSEINYVTILNILIYLGASALIAWSSMKIFSDIATSNNPFSEKQIVRIRIIAACFLAFCISDLVFSEALVSYDTASGWKVGFINDGGESGPVATLDINIMALMMSLLTYFFSVAFKYASLLQQNIDETL